MKVTDLTTQYYEEYEKLETGMNRQQKRNYTIYFREETTQKV